VYFKKNLFGLCLCFALISASFNFCEASNHHQQKYSSLVVNIRTGKVLHQEFAGYLRNPASLVKMMTLYMTFACIENHKLSMNQVLTVSKKAASQPRLNLDLKKGNKITVKEAILGLIVHSANDAAVVLAEAIAGSEEKFSEIMTEEAKALGMKNTTFKNASGLPHSSQKSTAYDLAKLAIALKRDFPQYFNLFSSTSFKYAGRVINTHNRVVKNYAWSDGLKTGYTRASGFNIVTSAKRGENHLVGIVLGGETAVARDTKVVSLLNKYFKKLEENDTTTSG